MHFYPDYLGFLEEHKLRIPSMELAIRPWTAGFICHLFDCHQFMHILEIGRGHGHSFGLFRWLNPASYVVSVDPRPTQTAQRIADLFNAEYKFVDDPSDVAFKNGIGIDFDLILIDGSHAQAAASRDWRNALEVAAPGATILFDNLDHKRGCGRVFYDEVPNESPVYCKLEPCGNQRDWPKDKRYKGTFGVVMLEEGFLSAQPKMERRMDIESKRRYVAEVVDQLTRFGSFTESGVMIRRAGDGYWVSGDPGSCFDFDRPRAIQYFLSKLPGPKK